MKTRDIYHLYLGQDKYYIMLFLMLSSFVTQRSPSSSIAKYEKQALLVSIKTLSEKQKMRY